MSDEKQELFCEYCKNGISLDDKKCPNCGADVTKIVNKYKKEKEKKEEDYNNRVLSIAESTAKTVGSAFKVSSIISVAIAVVAIVGFIVISVFIFKGFNSFSNNHNDSGNNGFFFDFEDDDDKTNDKVVEVGFNELAETKKFNVILDEYELFSYTADSFPDQYNTPEGYQKIAFHFDLENKLEEILTMSLDSRISLTADDYNVDRCDVEACIFCRAVSGKEKYKELPSTFISAKTKTEGYVGFLVPTKYKTLKFKIGSSVVITMDNPVYQ